MLSIVHPVFISPAPSLAERNLKSVPFTKFPPELQNAENQIQFTMPVNGNSDFR